MRNALEALRMQMKLATLRDIMIRSHALVVIGKAMESENDTRAVQSLITLYIKRCMLVLENK